MTVSLAAFLWRYLQLPFSYHGQQTHWVGLSEKLSTHTDLSGSIGRMATSQGSRISDLLPRTLNNVFFFFSQFIKLWAMWAVWQSASGSRPALIWPAWLITITELGASIGKSSLPLVTMLLWWTCLTDMILTLKSTLFLGRTSLTYSKLHSTLHQIWLVISNGARVTTTSLRTFMFIWSQRQFQYHEFCSSLGRTD